MKYVTKNTPRTEMFEAYKEAKNEILRLKRLHGNSKENKSKVIKNKNEKYDKLNYKLFKEKQKVYGKDKHIDNLRRHIQTKVIKARRAGYERAISQIKERDGRIIDMYTFLNRINVVTQIMGMSLNECAFILWAGTYNFYGTNDFKRDCSDTGVKFYAINNRMIKKNYVVAIDHLDNRKKTFALTATGLDMFSKIDKFTKKQFENE